MGLEVPTETELAEAIYRAAGAAFRELFAARPEEHFYYCTLTTTGGATWVTAAAWSYEAMARCLDEESGYERDAEELDAVVRNERPGPGEHEPEPKAEHELIWDYADSPYSMLGDQQFASVTALLARRPEMDCEDEDAWAQEWDLRLRSMERAMARLDEEGLFDRGEGRRHTLVAVEVMSPDFTNRERIERLNPPEVARWARKLGWSNE